MHPWTMAKLRPKRRARGALLLAPTPIRRVLRSGANCFDVVAALSLLVAPQIAWGQTHTVTPPVVKSHVDAVYPSRATDQGQHADVVLVVTVDADGHVTDVKVRESGGDLLDEAATIAIRQWTFEPARRDGTPVASRILVTFHFAPPEIVVPPKSDETVVRGGVVSKDHQATVHTARLDRHCTNRKRARGV